MEAASPRSGSMRQPQHVVVVHLYAGIALSSARWVPYAVAMEEETTKVNKDVGASEGITITEAAALLSVHPNTVRNRVRAGVYDADKVLTENGFTWMIDPTSLVNPPLPNASQQPASQLVNPETATSTEIIRDLLTPFVEDLGRVREELGAERVRREQAERERDELRRELEALREARESPETASDLPPGADPRGEGAGREAGKPRASWWKRIFAR